MSAEFEGLPLFELTDSPNGFSNASDVLCKAYSSDLSGFCLASNYSEARRSHDSWIIKVENRGRNVQCRCGLDFNDLVFTVVDGSFVYFNSAMYGSFNGYSRSRFPKPEFNGFVPFDSLDNFYTMSLPVKEVDGVKYYLIGSVWHKLFDTSKFIHSCCRDSVIKFIGSGGTSELRVCKICKRDKDVYEDVPLFSEAFNSNKYSYFSGSGDSIKYDDIVLKKHVGALASDCARFDLLYGLGKLFVKDKNGIFGYGVNTKVPVNGDFSVDDLFYAVGCNAAKIMSVTGVDFYEHGSCAVSLKLIKLCLKGGAEVWDDGTVLKFCVRYKLFENTEN